MILTHLEEKIVKICLWKWIVQCLLGEGDNSTIGRIVHWSGRGLFETEPILNTHLKYVIVWNISLYRPFWLRCGIPKYRF
jgi:hypothetical protein